MNTAAHIHKDKIEQDKEMFAERLLSATAGVFDIFTIHIGHQLGYYNVLAEKGALTAGALALHTGTHERYAREWLEQQAVAGILKVENADAKASDRTFFIPAGHIEVLTDQESLDFLAPMAQLVVGVTRPVQEVIDAFRKGGGVAYDKYGVDVREGVSQLNRPMFLKLLGTEWLPGLPDIHARLGAKPAARVADIGCGQGWSSIAMASAYPEIQVHGFDLDAPSIEQARRNAESAGLNGRVAFHVRDASDPSLRGNYDLVTAFECIHDMADPVSALENMRKLSGDKGSVLVMDERTTDSFTTRDSGFDGLFYGFSILACLPAGMSEAPSAQTGTVMRPDTLKRYALAAGFSDMEVLPIDNIFFRFYRLRQ